MQSYNVIVGVVDMKLKGFSYEDIRMRHKVGSSTITLIMNRFYDVEKSIDELKSLPPRDVEELFYPPASRRRRKIPLSDWEQIHSRMLYLGKHADLSLIWIQYKEQNPNGYQLSQFYRLYSDYLKSIGERHSA